MFLFKASGATYHRVVRRKLHAFQYSPADVQGDEFILLSKNSEDCGPTEPQVQAVAKLLRVRRASALELEEHFPGVDAAERWDFIIELYWVLRLDSPFNLSGVPGFSAKRYNQVQGFAKLDPQDELALLSHLIRTNARVVLDIVNDAARPDEPAS